jgi:hypothetical protein
MAHVLVDKRANELLFIQNLSYFLGKFLNKIRLDFHMLDSPDLHIVWVIQSIIIKYSLLCELIQSQKRQG